MMLQHGLKPLTFTFMIYLYGILSENPVLRVVPP